MSFEMEIIDKGELLAAQTIFKMLFRGIHYLQMIYLVNIGLFRMVIENKNL